MSPSCSTKNGSTNQSWKIACKTRPNEPNTNSRPMGRYVKRTVCFGAHTNSHYGEPHHKGTKPATDRRKTWSMYRAPRSQRYSSQPQTDSKPRCDLAGRTTTCGCYCRPWHATSVRRHCHSVDWHPQRLLEIWAPSAEHLMAPPSTAGTLSPHTNRPRYSGTTPVATYTLRTGLGRVHGHRRVGTQHHSRMEILPGSVGHQTLSH